MDGGGEVVVVAIEEIGVLFHDRVGLMIYPRSRGSRAKKF